MDSAKRTGLSQDDGNPAGSTLAAPEFLHAFQLDRPPVDRRAIARAVADLLDAVGEDREREGLFRTPERVARAYAELLSGYRTDPVRLVNNALFDVDYDDMVVVRDIEFASLGEADFLPFLGHVHVGYIPDGKVIGLSKIPRIVEMFARRLQAQERLTHQIADFLEAVLQPKGVAVAVDGLHLSSWLRGGGSRRARVTTHAVRGVFREDRKVRREFLAQLEQKRSLTL
jgi:GTP cyclohydrolase I